MASFIVIGILIFEEEMHQAFWWHIRRRIDIETTLCTPGECSRGRILGGITGISFTAGAAPRLSRVPFHLGAGGGFVAGGEASITRSLPPVTRAGMASTGYSRGGGVDGAGSKEPCVANAFFPIFNSNRRLWEGSGGGISKDLDSTEGGIDSNKESKVRHVLARETEKQ